MKERSKGLEELGDFFKELAKMEDLDMYIASIEIFTNKDTLQRIAKSKLKPWKKLYQDHYFYIMKEFSSGIRLSINIPRELVCQRVVVETIKVPEQVVPAHDKEIVEWVCSDSLIMES